MTVVLAPPPGAGPVTAPLPRPCPEPGDAARAPVIEIAYRENVEPYL